MLAEFQLWALSAIIVVALVAQCVLWGPLPMLSEPQLWVLSTFVLVALAVVCVMLPARG